MKLHLLIYLNINLSINLKKKLIDFYESGANLLTIYAKQITLQIKDLYLVFRIINIIINLFLIFILINCLNNNMFINVNTNL